LIQVKARDELHKLYKIKKKKLNEEPKASKENRHYSQLIETCNRRSFTSVEINSAY
jgi:hypothetical protein